MLREGYVLFDETIEKIQPNEEEIGDRIVGYGQRASEAVVAKDSPYGRAPRAAHAKGHGILKGEIRVNANLPAHLRQGVFATPGTYPVIVRFSTAFGDFRSDSIKAARGMALKILGVNGEKALASDDSRNQDFLLVNHPIYFADVVAYETVAKLLSHLPNTPDLVMKASEIGASGAEKLLSLVGIEAPIEISAVADEGFNILGETFYSMAAIRFGDYIAKLSAAPSPGSANKQLEGIPAGPGDNVLQDIVAQFFKNRTAEFDLRAQLCKDLDQMPVENASVRWPEALSEHEPVARLILPPQEPLSQARLEYDDIISFTPWRCLAAHRPLGSIMRLRRKAYESSSKFRHDQNKKRAVEPSDIADVPD